MKRYASVDLVYIFNCWDRVTKNVTGNIIIIDRMDIVILYDHVDSKNNPVDFTFVNAEHSSNWIGFIADLCKQLGKVFQTSITLPVNGHPKIRKCGSYRH